MLQSQGIGQFLQPMSDYLTQQFTASQVQPFMAEVMQMVQQRFPNMGGNQMQVGTFRPTAEPAPGLKITGDLLAIAQPYHMGSNTGMFAGRPAYMSAQPINLEPTPRFPFSPEGAGPRIPQQILFDSRLRSAGIGGFMPQQGGLF